MSGSSLRVLSVAASSVIALWFLYVAVGWAIAPGVCTTPGFHIVSGFVLVGAATTMFMLGTRSHTNQDGGGARIERFMRLFWLRLGVLFVVAVGLAWLLAALWC
jgi:multisubunit Na+/H+ antiporter MnhB subunit